METDEHRAADLKHSMWNTENINLHQMSAEYKTLGCDDESDAGEMAKSELFYLLPEQMDEAIKTWYTKADVERFFTEGCTYTELDKSAIIAFYESNPNTGTSFDEMKERVMRWKLWQQFNSAMLHPSVVFAVLNLVMDGSVEIKRPYNAVVRKHLVETLGYTDDELERKCNGWRDNGGNAK